MGKIKGAILTIILLFLTITPVYAEETSIVDADKGLRIEQTHAYMPTMQAYYYTEESGDDITATFAGQEMQVSDIKPYDATQGMDYYFLIDVSASIADSYFQDMKEGIIQFHAPLNIAVRQVNSTELVVADESKRKIYQHGRKRFYEEAEALYKCRDIPEIVSLIGYFQENNTAYFAMEYIEGLTLRNYAKLYPNRRVAEKKAVEIVSKTCIALEQVHSKTHIFHRDISPENIMIMRDERIKLIDFGSAKNLDGAKSKFSIVLKPGFAPPEQYISTGQQGRYTDVYALAGTLYFLLSGQTLPPAPERASGVTYVKLKDMGYGITPALSDAIDRGLILKIEDRIQTAAEFGNLISDACGLPAISGIGPSMTGTAAKPYVEVVSGIMNHAKWYLPPDKNVLLGRSEEDDIVTQGSQMISNRHT